MTIGTDIEITTVEGAKVTLRARNETASVLSLVGGAALRLTGVEVRDGSCGLSLGADARVEITGCIVSGNSWYGILLENHAQATITYCGISGNGLSGIMLTNFARAAITFYSNAGGVRDGDRWGWWDRSSRPVTPSFSYRRTHFLTTLREVLHRRAVSEMFPQAR